MKRSTEARALLERAEKAAGRSKGLAVLANDIRAFLAKPDVDEESPGSPVGWRGGAEDYDVQSRDES